MTIRQAQFFIKKYIGNIEADMLLEYILKVDKQYLIINHEKLLNPKEQRILKICLRKIKNGMPLQYITSKSNFMGMEFDVNKNVLIPQPDTEILVEQALKMIELFNDKEIKVLDLCTGSGCIAISIAKYAKNVDIYASDISPKALEVANKNYEKLINNENKIKFIQSDMFKNINEKFDIIVSNPPYIEKNIIKKLDKQVRKEPKIALNGGNDGLMFYRIIKENVDRFLNNDGILLMEIGYDQKSKVQSIFEGSICIKDLSGQDRVIIWRK